MTLRIVLYAEGGRETGGAFDPPPHAGALLVPDHHWGPAHWLILRALCHVRSLPEGAVQFEAPLRDGTRIPRGSELLDRGTLRRLLTWFPGPVHEPDLAIVLVDGDADPGRRATLESFVADKSVTKVVAVAIQEFETWLIADQNAVQALFGSVHATLPDLEGLQPGHAKKLLMQWIDASGRPERDVRVTLAKTIELAEVTRRCAAFDAFVRALR